MQKIMRKMISAVLFMLIFSINSIILASENPRYITYPTENINTVLKLDTAVGTITQVHIGIGKDGIPGEFYINALPLADTIENGRFALQKTGNMYNFILLDTVDGRVWQVQWSFIAENRLIFPIK